MGKFCSDEMVYFSKEGDTIDQSFLLKLSTPSNTGVIYYTLDGNIPDNNSSIYNNETGIFINAHQPWFGNHINQILLQDQLKLNASCYEFRFKSFESNLPYYYY